MSTKQLEACKICNVSDWSVSYAGPIRLGQFGQYRDAVVSRCNSCQVEYLPPKRDNIMEFYQSGEYRESVDEGSNIETFLQLHDAEHLNDLKFLKSIPIRGKVIADVGCGGGSFLDLVSGYASVTLAIEPTRTYHKSLRDRGHLVFPDVSNALDEWRGRVDVVTSLNVIEHVEDPVSFLQELRLLLADDGIAVITTPNLNDILVEVGVEAYRSFFYRDVHIFNFNENALRVATQAAGFREFTPFYMHDFNFANFVNWLTLGKPTGNSGKTGLGKLFDHIWQATLEEKGFADTLGAYIRA